jgi:hypothetical protein
MRRFPSDAGIAIGPILFVIALLGILATAMSVGTGDFGTATVADRVYNDVMSQGNLVRVKINECNMKYGTNNNGDGWPASDPTNGTPVCALACEGDPSTAETGTDCAGNAITMQNIWSGMRPTLLPPPTGGFAQWYYMNAGASGGRCIWTEPTASTNEGMLAGLTKVTTKFSTQEMTYSPTGTTHRVVIWLTLPQGSPDAHCTSP